MNANNILGGIPGLFDETDFEKETSKVAGSIFEAITSLSKDIFPSKGTLEFTKPNKANEEKERKQKADAKRREAFFKALKEDMVRAKDAKDKLLSEEEIYDIISNLPTEQKNQLLHYQASYRDRSIYQRAELRKKLIEEQKKAQDKQKKASVPSPAKQPSALEGAFEGRSGSQGGGQANLSNQAVG